MDAVDPRRTLPDPPSDPAARPPARRPGSVRRTSTVLMHWPGGAGTQLRLDGRARDLLTPLEGQPRVLAQDEYRIGVGADRTLEEVEISPSRGPDIGRLVGARGGSALRAVLREVAPAELDDGTPLCLILDDIAGSTLIAGFAWSRWSDAWMRPGPLPDGTPRSEPRRRTMAGICAGFRPGSSALGPDGGSRSDLRHNVAGVPPLADPDDPWSWHELDPHPPVAMRRARRVDVWTEGGTVVVDAMFRDSCWQPDGVEVAVHEYSLEATIDAASGTVSSVEATPRVLPFAECPAAAPNASWMVGASARGLRTEVLERLRSTDCCTHLNDALRSLAEVPVLAAALAGPDRRMPGGAVRSRTRDGDGVWDGVGGDGR
jgi:Protein of unknown function (DUF2889)